MFRFPVKAYHQGAVEGDDREDISIHLLKQPQEEISFVAECVKKLRREGYRYRDIAVVAGDMEVYGPLARDISDKRRSHALWIRKRPFLPIHL